MDRYKETFETWNKIASVYQDKFMDFDLYNDTYDALIKHLKKPSPNILEIGCGPGNVTRYMLSKRPDFKILGIDIAPNMISLATKNNPYANFKVMDCRQIHGMETQFDAIICGFCLPYLSASERSIFIKNCNHLLLGKGLLYLSFVEGNSVHSGFQTGSSGDRMYFYYHGQSDVKNDLIKNNFSLVHAANKNYPKKDGTSEAHIILIARHE